MLNPLNIFKASLICALLNAAYTFFISSGMFVEQLASEGQETGRIEAFINAAQITENFWPHIIEGWAYGFGLSLISCLILLLWLKKENT